ncbi:hypothetical protein BDN72DRAFT_222762 [Pluteus cervinus]|uniref:Uncharacterized protein n=1 Tax=Pluteus cervinus TaxID=181527 RepID=A0ACD3AH91_9AGAR|nr:hypothetical protein BDN72DRAFT_222762 [Pluteus cervinus]
MNESGADRHQPIAELPEYDVLPLNLGAEDPEDMATPVIGDENRLARVNTSVVVRRRSWSPKRWRSYTKSFNMVKDVVDMDCGICFETAVLPCQTLCCGGLFCLEHIADWLHGPNSNGRCPTCQSPCTLSLSSLVLKTPGAGLSTSPPTSPTPRPRSDAQIQYAPTSPTPSTSSLTSDISNTSLSSSSSSNTSTSSHSTWASFSLAQPNNAEPIRQSCLPTSITVKPSLTPKPSMFFRPTTPHIAHPGLPLRSRQVVRVREEVLVPKDWGPIVAKLMSFVALMLVYYVLFS